MTPVVKEAYSGRERGALEKRKRLDVVDCGYQARPASFAGDSLNSEKSS
jgi:hypothetical protein